MFDHAGAVGLEALSRGCKSCHFVEMDPGVARDSLAKNIQACGVKDKSTVLTLVLRLSDIFFDCVSCF